LCSFQPAEFSYNKPLGEGAFGKVRKCEFEYKEKTPEVNPENPEISEPIMDIDDMLARKKSFSEDGKKVMAVKI
jgi:hypothetical protein